MKKILLRTEEDRDMWRRLVEDCNNKQGEEIERLRQENKERSERLGLATALERSKPAGNVHRGQFSMEFLTPRKQSQTTEAQIPAAPGRVMIQTRVTPW